METVLSTPYIVRIIVSLFVILIVNRISDKLNLSVLCGIVFLGLVLGHSAESIFRISLNKVFAANTLFLILVIFQVIWLSHQMSDAGVMSALVGSVGRGLSKRGAMAVLPAVIGFLPMPGGALFSAPLVDECDSDQDIPPLVKAEVNYWFRHVWEYWWPLYPGVLLAVDLTGLTVFKFMAFQFPMSLISVLAGYWFILRKVGDVTNGKSYKLDAFRETLIHTLPVFIIIVTYAGIKLLFPALSEVNKYLPMIAGITLSQIFLQIRIPLTLSGWGKIIISGKTLNLALIVLLILVYGSFISSPLPDGSFCMDHMKGELASWGIPLFLVIMLLPFISGLTTGIALGFVGASFPVVLTLAGGDISYIVLAYGCGYMGMILSPVHVCLVVTAEHFRTDVAGVIRALISPAVMVIFGILVLHFSYKVILN